MKTAQRKQQAKPCLSDRYKHAESDSYVCNATVGPNRSVAIGHGIGFGSPNWSRSTVWFRRPDDVAMPERKSAPVRNLQAIAKPNRAPIAPTESVCMSGVFAGIVTPDKKGKRATGDSANDIATALEKRLAQYVTKAEPSTLERAEIAEINRLKREAAKVEAKAKRDRQAAIRHSSPSDADKQAEIARNEARKAFEEQSLARKVANAEEAASDPVLWAEAELELESEMAGR